jgi:tetratricopeptide (TPR) repeat protein
VAPHPKAPADPVLRECCRMSQNKKRHGPASRTAAAPAAAHRPARAPVLAAARPWYRHPALLAAGLLVAATLVTYWPALENGFVFDDIDYVTLNPQVQAGLTGPSIAWAFTTGHASNWHPLTWLSLELDRDLFGPEPWGYHLTNLVLHVANALLLFLVFWKMTTAVWPSAFVAALFALHPLHVESVAWVTERKDVLSTLFGLLALLAYWAYARRPALGRYLLVVLAFALSLLAKPMLVTLPFLLLLLDYWPLGRLRLVREPLAERHRAAGAAGPVAVARLILEKVPLLLLAAASCVATWLAQQHGHSVQRLAQLPLALRAGNAVVAYAVYLRKVLWPTDLAAFYPHPGSSLPWSHVAAPALLLVAVTALALWLRRRAPYLFVGWFWYLGTLVPVIGLVQVGSQGLADRYTYVPLVGIFIMAAWGVADLVARRPAQAAAPAALGWAVILVACALITWLQVHHWQDNLHLWHHALEVLPDNAFAHTNLGVAIMENASGPDDETAAFSHFTRALQIDPDQARASLGLALLAQQRGRIEEAVQRFRRVLHLEPTNEVAQRGLASNLARQLYLRGEALRREGKRAEAIACFREALSLARAGGDGALAAHVEEQLRLCEGQPSPAQSSTR